MPQLEFEALRKALFHIYEHSYHNLCHLQSVSTNPYLTYTIVNLNKEKYSFEKDFNKKADLVFFTSNDVQYLKFSLAININVLEDRIERKNKSRVNKPYVTLRERGMQHRPVPEIFIDRLKVPDDEVLFTLFDAGMDIYVPLKYFGEYSRMSIIVNKFSPAYPYFNQTVTGTTDDSFMIQPTKKMVADVNNIRFFKNGVFLTPERDYSIVIEEDNRIFFSIIDGLLPTDKIEVNNSHHCVFTETVLDKKDPFIFFPENIMEDLPIYFDAMEVYVDGKRLTGTDINILTARHFSIKDFVEHSTVTVRLSYNLNIITRYTDDILEYLKHITDPDKIKDILSGEDTPPFFSEFPPPHTSITDIDPSELGMTYEEFVEYMLNHFIIENTENLKRLLSQFFEKNDYYYDMDDIDDRLRDDTSPDLGGVNFTEFDSPRVVFAIYSKYPDFIPLFFADGKKIKQSEILFIKYLGVLYCYIDYEDVKNANRVRVEIIPIFNRNYNHHILEMTEDNVLDLIYPLDREFFGKIRYYDDILVMKQEGEGCVYLRPNIDYVLEDNDNLDLLIMNKHVGDKYIIYNCSFFDFYYMQPSQLDNEYKNITIYDKYDSTKGIYLPRLTNYTRYIFVSGREMLEGLDFYISNQRMHSGITLSKLIFKNVPKGDDWIEVVCAEQYRQLVDMVDKVNSLYGLVHFKNSKIPISLRYTDIYVNGIKAIEEDIEYIADRIIRVKNFDEVNDVAVFTKLRIPLYLLEDFLNTYGENPSDWEKWLEDNYVYNPDPEIDLDDWIEEHHPEVPPLPGDPDIDPIFRIDAFLNYVGYNLIHGLIPRRLDANKYLSFLNEVEYLELMEDPTLTDIPLDPNKSILFKVDVDCEGTLVPANEVARLIVNAILSGDLPPSLDVNRLLLDYEGTLLSDKVYPEELILLDQNYEMSEDLVVDANK